MHKLVHALPALLATVLVAATPQQCKQIDLNFTPAEQALIQGDLDNICPLLIGLSPAVRVTFNQGTIDAYGVALTACPPNPPPTNVLVIALDLFNAYTVLAPHIPALNQKASHIIAIMKAHGA